MTTSNETSLESKDLNLDTVSFLSRIKEIEPIERKAKENAFSRFDKIAGSKIGEYYASDNTEYSFCQDGTLKISHHFRLFYTGNWILLNDTIWLTLLKKHEKNGVGEHLPRPEPIPNSYIDRYPDYEEKITLIHEIEFLIFSEIEVLIQQDNKYPYQLLETDIECDLTNWEKFDE